jgi:hypothetical protein
MPKVAYIHSPEVQIQCEFISSKWVDLPHIVFQVFDVPEI